MKILILFFCCFLLILASGCKHDPIVQYDCTGITPGYTADIKSILDANCATSGCHSGGSPAKGINLENYLDASAASADKNFLGAIQQLSGYTKMPKGSGKLPDSEIKILTCWVQSGSPQ